MNYYAKAFINYANFSGRASRSEYWYFTLFNFIFIIAAIILDNIIGTAIDGVGYGLIYAIYALATFIPGLSAGIRRLHDAGKSGWMLLLVFIPIIGSIWLIVLLCKESENGENKWGGNPNY